MALLVQLFIVMSKTTTNKVFTVPQAGISMKACSRAYFLLLEEWVARAFATEKQIILKVPRALVSKIDEQEADWVKSVVLGVQGSYRYVVIDLTTIHCSFWIRVSR